MMVLVCLLNLIFYAIIALFAIWVVSLVIGMFIPGVNLFPHPGQPPPNRVIALVYLMIGIVLLINFLLCVLGHGSGRELLPPIWVP